MNSDHAVISAFQAAADSVPAYRQILDEGRIDPAKITTMEDFCAHVPILDKKQTFGQFNVAELCRGGNPGALAGVLTSSGHSGQFAFGLYNMESAETASRGIDEALDLSFGILSRTTLLINCLPMGVKVYTRACTVAETSVRPDMVTALVDQFAKHYEQIILVGEAAFIKLVLEQGQDKGIDWRDILVHAIVGEEPLAENARTYLESLMGIDPADPATGLVASSMGVAELGLNLFFELPPLIAMRRRLHQDAELRSQILGDDAAGVGMLFTYDPRRIHVEVVQNDQLVVSTLDPKQLLPLIRYSTGDSASFIDPQLLASALGQPIDFPLIMIHGRGKWALSGDEAVYPEQVKEALYHDHELARLITGNFRLYEGTNEAQVRIQLAPNVPESAELTEGFNKAVSNYITPSVAVSCENYETFGDGMSLDYERKFAYMDAKGPSIS